MGWRLYEASDEAQRSSRWTEHTHRVLRTISAVENHLARAESALRGYVVSGNALFLVERDSALAELDGGVTNLKSLVADSPEQQASAAKLRDRIAGRIAIMKETLRQYDLGGQSSAAATLRDALRSTESIYELTGEMRSAEERLLNLRQRDEDFRYHRTMMLLIGAAVLALVILVPSYVAFMLQTRARERVERRLYDMADSIPGVVYQYRSSAEGVSRYDFLSTGLEGMFGIARKAVLANAAVVADMISEEDKPALSAAVAKAADTLSPLEHEFRIRPPGGGTKWVRTSAAPRKEDDGSIVWNGHWADITRQKDLEHALHEAKEAADTASRAKSTFLAVVSHEIRTPLSGVLGMLELLAMSPLNADQRSTLNVVRESGKSLQRIIDDILDFSKIEAGKLEIAPEPSSIREVVESTRNIYAGNASSKGLLLWCHVDERISPALLVDPLRLRQILNNLVSNAIKFTSHGTIEVSAVLLASAEGVETVRLSVVDHGVGMSPEAQARVFQPFLQGASTVARSFGGTGLGLAICRRLATMMGGSIEVDSRLGGGTTMRLTLPLPVADARELQPEHARPSSGPEVVAARQPPSIEQAERDRTLVLLVDDHPTNRMLLLRQLNALGYAAETVTNGVEALAKWKTGRFAAVITDCNMPEMDGYQLAREIRETEAKHRLGRTPLLACTANALRGEAEACMEAGMDDYVPTPVELAQLQRKLYQWLPLATDAAGATRTTAEPLPVEPGGGGDPVVDRSVLSPLTGGNRSIEREILAEFQRATHEDAAMLEEAVRRGVLKQATTASHRLKGSSRMVGLKELAAVCDRIEQASRAKDLAAVQDSMEALHSELERVNIYIERFNETEKTG